MAEEKDKGDPVEASVVDGDPARAIRNACERLRVAARQLHEHGVEQVVVEEVEVVEEAVRKLQPT